MTDWQTIQTTFEETQAAFFANETSETARAYFFASIDLWKDGALDDWALEYVAHDCGKYLGRFDK